MFGDQWFFDCSVQGARYYFSQDLWEVIFPVSFPSIFSPSVFNIFLVKMKEVKQLAMFRLKSKSELWCLTLSRLSWSSPNWADGDGADRGEVSLWYTVVGRQRFYCNHNGYPGKQKFHKDHSGQFREANFYFCLRSKGIVLVLLKKLLVLVLFVINVIQTPNLISCKHLGGSDSCVLLS